MHLHPQIQIPNAFPSFFTVSWAQPRSYSNGHKAEKMKNLVCKVTNAEYQIAAEMLAEIEGGKKVHAI